MKIKETAVGLYQNLVSHWNKPAKGNYVSYKEIANYGIGGIGQNFFVILIGYFGLSAANTLLGSTIGIRPMHLQYMAMIQTVLNLFFYSIRGYLVDNTRTKWGRFRPYIAVMGIPLMILSIVFLFLDFKSMSYMNKLIATGAFTFAITMIAPLLTDTYTELGSVITPNTEERTVVLTANALIYSIAPTVAYAVLPMLSELTGGYTNINTYRYIVVPMALIGVGLNLFTAFGCKERVVSSKTYVQKVGMIEGCLEIYKNKYWWIKNISSYVGFLEGACGILFSWMYIYGSQNMVAYGILNTVLGTAATISMLISPYLLKHIGNRKILLAHNALNIVFIIFMLITFKVAAIFFIFVYLNSIVNQLSIVYSPVMHSELKDYQQYISGKRMDFMFGMASQINIPVVLVTGLAIPFVYESMGLTTNYDILFDPKVRNSMFYILCLLSIVGAILNLIPFFFYNLSRAKHRNYIKVLHYRALFEDFVEGTLTPETIKTAIEGVREGYALLETPMPNIKEYKKALKDAKSLPKTTEDEKQTRRRSIKLAKKELFNASETIENIKENHILIDEINKFDNPLIFEKLKLAQQLSTFELNDIANIDDRFLKQAMVLPNSTKNEKKIKKYAIKQAKMIAKMPKKIMKNYPNGILEPIKERIVNAYDLPQTTNEERKIKRLEIKDAEKEIKIYSKTLKVYINAQKLVKEYNGRVHWNTIESMYENAVIQVAENERMQEEKYLFEKQRKAEEQAKNKQEREERKLNKKSKKNDKEDK